MIVLDSSAVIAILANEIEADSFLRALVSDAARAMSAGTFLELSIVARRLRQSPDPAERFINRFRIEIMPFDASQARIAAEAYRRFGRGNHSAGLNYGDCFAYALAKSLAAPLLFKGGDFTLTDVRRAIPS